MNRILFNNNSPTAFFYNGNVVNKIIFNGHEVYTKETPVPTPPNDEIWYTSSDGNIVTPYDASVFGANIVSNTYSEGKGIIKFDGDITSIGAYAFRDCTSLTSINIPDSVTSIGVSAFNNCTSLTSINIPDSVTSIGGSAFYNCSSLSSINIPNSVTSINSGAFRDCTSLTSINIPDSVTSIGGSAFNGCTALTQITIPNSVTSINSGAFRNCSSLTSITINAITPPALVSNNVFLNTNDCPIYVPAESVYTYKAATNWSAYSLRIQAIQIPIPSNEIWYTSSDGNIVTPYDASVFGANIVSNTYSEGKGIIKFDGDITSIGLYAFRQRSSLTSVTIPNSVTSIGGSAFSGCSALTSVTIPNSVTSIGVSAFNNCSSLTSINIPSSVTSINNSAFCDCSSLESITVNATTPPSLGSGVFDNTNDCPIYVKIESVNSYKAATNWSDYAYRIQFEPIPIQTNEIWYTSSDGQKVTPYNTSAFGANISSNTYENGKGIIKFRGNVTSIGDHAFIMCTTLASINIPSSVTSIGSSAFQVCRALTSINIPNSVTSIGDWAFGECPLTSINIPNSVTSIGEWAIGCSSLKLVTIPSSVTSIGQWAFLCPSLTKITVLNPTPASLGSAAFDDTNDCPIYVPAESVDAYKAATNWSTYAARIQAIPE